MARLGCRFDVLIARDGHTTNQIMKVLTLVSVILLPGALVAGVMGMNFKVRLFDDPAILWVVVAVIVAFAPLTIGIAKLRKWIQLQTSRDARAQAGRAYEAPSVSP